MGGGALIPAWTELAGAALGLLNVVLLAPTWMQLVHLLLADLLWLALVGLAATTLATAPRD